MRAWNTSERRVNLHFPIYSLYNYIIQKNISNLEEFKLQNIDLLIIIAQRKILATIKQKVENFTQ